MGGGVGQRKVLIHTPITAGSVVEHTPIAGCTDAYTDDVSSLYVGDNHIPISIPDQIPDCALD